MISFNELGVDKEIIKAIEELGFEHPMPIQEEVISFLFSNQKKDLIALAQTGTGKTAAFGIPLVQESTGKPKAVSHLILSPTRELCLQIADDLKDFSKYKKNVKIVALFGGASIDKQIKKLKYGAHILSATPGRLIDLIQRGQVDISNIQTLVLDEADEMLNMGFRDELETIISQTPKNRTTLLFSATMPKEVLKLSQKYMNKPHEITIGKKNAGAENVTHSAYFVNSKDRYLALKRIVDFNPDIYGIIFCRTRKETQEVATKLIKDGYNSDALHGDLSQAQREYVMSKFKIKHLKLLVATDVAARGLDVDSLSHVINYNLPDENEIYIHRSGRTGRAGKFGESIVIASLREKRKIKDIEAKIGKSFVIKSIPTGKEVCNKQLLHLIDRLEKLEVDHSQIDDLLPDIIKKLEWFDRDELIKKFVSLEFNRLLEYYKSTPDLNNQKERGKFNKNSSSDSMTRFFINLGKKDKLKPTDVIGLIKDNSANKEIKIGEIEILENFSFFETEPHEHDKLIAKMNKKSFGRRKIKLEIASRKTKSKEKPLKVKIKRKRLRNRKLKA